MLKDEMIQIGASHFREREMLISQMSAMPSTNLTLALSKNLMLSGIHGEFRSTISRTQILRHGLILFEKNFSIEMDVATQVIAADAYYNLWKTCAYQGDLSIITRSQELFKHVHPHNSCMTLPVPLLLKYVAALRACSLNQSAAEIMTLILHLSEQSSCYSSALLQAADLYHAMGDWERAASLLHDCLSAGPPAPLKKLDIMFLLSRNLEIRAELSEEADPDDAYSVVHKHSVIDGSIRSDCLYQDWLHDGSTWTGIAMACFDLQCQSLARDLIAQALMRDEDTFRSCNIWPQFAMCCFLLGLRSDAQLSIRQMLSLGLDCADVLMGWDGWDLPGPSQPFQVTVLQTSVDEVIARIHEMDSKER